MPSWNPPASPMTSGTSYPAAGSSFLDPSPAMAVAASEESHRGRTHDQPRCDGEDTSAMFGGRRSRRSQRAGSRAATAAEGNSRGAREPSRPATSLRNLPSDMYGVHTSTIGSRYAGNSVCSPTP